MKRLTLLAVLFTMIAGQAWGTDYYVRPCSVDSTCSYGSCNGTDYANAWEGFASCGAGEGTPVNWTTVDTGDGKLFVAGTHREQLVIGESGEEGVPIQVVSCTIANGASDNDPAILLGSSDYDSAVWSASDLLSGVHTYKTADSSFTTDVGMIYYNVNGTIGYATKVFDSAEMDSDFEFWYDATDDCVHIHSSTGPPNSIWDGVEIPNDGVGSIIVKMTPGDNRSYITIDGLTVQYFNKHGICGGDVDHITVQNCTVQYGGGAWQGVGTTRFGNGIGFDNNVSNVTIQNNTALQIYDSCYCLELFNDDNETIDGATISGNICSNSYWGVHIYIEDDATVDVITDVTISDNTISNSGSPFGLTRSTAAAGINLLKLDVSETMSNIVVDGNSISTSTLYGINAVATNTVTISKNSISGTANDGIHLNGTDTSNLQYNIIYGNTDSNGMYIENTVDSIVYNNTIFNTATTANKACLRIINAATSGLIIKNNILYDNGDADTKSLQCSQVTPAALDYNLYYSTTNAAPITLPSGSYATAAAVRAATAYEDHGVDGNPLFLSAGSNFHLASNSPAINAGTDVGLTQDYDSHTVPYGAGVDIGSLEWVKYVMILTTP